MTTQSETALLAGGALIALATGVAFAVGDSLASGLVGGAIVLAFVLVVAGGRRHSATLEVMSGIGDERTRHLYTVAVAWTGTVMSVLLPAWWLVTLALGDSNETLNLVCAIFGVTFIACVVVISRRG
jgi:hypothetical protein